MPVPRFVLLDLYETLVHADMASVQAGRKAIAARLGVSPEAMAAAYEATAAGRFLGRFGGAADDMAAVVDAAGVPAGDGLIGDLVEVETRLWSDSVVLYPDVETCLEVLRAAGHRLALVSNCGFQTRPLIEAWGLDHRLDVVVLSHEVRLGKPDPAIYRLALHRLGGEPGEALMVDDQVSFLDAAAAVGMFTHQMRRFDWQPASRHPGITSLSQLLASE